MKKVMFIVLFASAISAYAQKVKVIEGDFSALKGLKGVRTEFAYDNMSVGKFDKEADYIAKKKGEFNEKEAGKGEQWEKAWINDRSERFEPQFRELFNKHSGLSTVDESSPVTLIFKTTHTEPGFNVGVASKPALIDAEVWFVDSSNKDKVLTKVLITKAPGRTAFGYDFETGLRLQEAYAKAGKELGNLVKSKAK